MKQNHSCVALAALAVVATLFLAGPVAAQVAGRTTNVTESTTFTPGWSVKKTLMGKLIYNDAGVKVGKVKDLIVSPDKNVSFVIVGAGGFVGIDRHDVAIAVSQIQNKGGKLLLAGATPETIKALPDFTYGTGTKK